MEQKKSPRDDFYYVIPIDGSIVGGRRNDVYAHYNNNRYVRHYFDSLYSVRYTVVGKSVSCFLGQLTHRTKCHEGEGTSIMDLHNSIPRSQ